MKRNLLLGILLLPIIYQAQVGINTSAPNSTFDVAAKNTTGTSTNVDGLLVPRVDRQRAQSMTSVPTSTLIYISDANSGSQTGTAVNIDTVGHYFYNGTVWTKLNSPTGAPASVNLYNTDGILTGNRLVTQGSSTLAFTSNAVNGFSVAGNTFSVDAANSRVGIGTSAPNSRLDLGISFGASTADAVGKKLAVYNNATGTSFYGLGVNSNTLQFHAASAAAAVPGMILTAGGKVGIGTTTPNGTLSVSGSGAGTVPILSVTNTNVAGNPVLNIYPGYTSNVTSISEGNQYAVVFDQDPGQGSVGALQSLYDFHGQIRSVSSSTLSDVRLKKDIKNLNEYGLAEVMRLQPKRYVLKEYDTPDVGLIAQELKAILPEIVYGDESKGLLSVDYAKISLVLINAMKEQQKIILTQGEQIKALQTDVKALKSKR